MKEEMAGMEGGWGEREGVKQGESERRSEMWKKDGGTEREARGENVK